MLSRKKTDAELLADAILELASAIRQYTASIYHEDTVDISPVTYMDGKPVD